MFPVFLQLNSSNLYDLRLSCFQGFCQKLETLFGNVGVIELTICDSREELVEKTQEQLGELPSWVVGLTKGHCVYLLSPNEIRDRQMNFENILKHEIVHIFVNQFSNNCPIWLNEGIAQNLSEDVIGEKECLEVKLTNPYDHSYESGLYFCSKIVVRMLFEIYGVPNVINCLKSCKNFRKDSVFGYNSIEKLITVRNAQYFYK